MRVFYKPKDAWVGDAIPFWDGRYRVFFLADRRAGGSFGEKTSWDVVETDDLLHFAERGTAIAPGDEAAHDRNAYTGSALKDTSGRQHIFYTGHNPKITQDGIPLQVVLHATSTDGQSWAKDQEFVLGADGQTYDVHDWRDPFVFWSEEEGRYIMLVTARLRGKPAREGGCIAALYSDDLENWTFGEPFFQTDQYVTLECPDYFHWGDWHYLVYSTFSDRFVTHYRKSRSFRGPYLSAASDTFDGRGCYAIKTAGTELSRAAFGWVPSKTGNSDYGDWDWAGTLIAHELWQDADGDLQVRIPAAIKSVFSEATSPALDYAVGYNFAVDDSTLRLAREDGQSKCVLQELRPQTLIEARFSNWSARDFGVAFRCDETFDQGYFIRFEPAFNRIVFDMWPRRIPGEFQWQIAGDRPQLIELERPLSFEGLEDIVLKLIVEDDIFVLNVNDRVAMTGRCYNFPEGRLAFFSREGAVTVSDIAIKNMPQDGIGEEEN